LIAAAPSAFDPAQNLLGTFTAGSSTVNTPLLNVSYTPKMQSMSYSVGDLLKQK